MLEILKYFPLNISNKINNIVNKNADQVQEIRVRINGPIILKINEKKTS